MILYDYNREWKRYQRIFTRLTVQMTADQMQSALNTIDRARVDEIQTQLGQAEADMAANRDAIAGVERRLEDLNAAHFATNRDRLNQRAIYDVEKFQYEEALANRPERAPPLGQQAEERFARITELETATEALALEIRAAEDELATYVGRRDDLLGERDTLVAEYTRLQAAMNALDPGLMVTSFRNAPILDMLNPSEKIRQIILPNLHNEHPFMQIERVDRCTTCHLGIDQPAWEGGQQPFAAHPDLDVFVGSDSPHPMDQFGCTTCHGGLDRAPEFSRAGHTPVDEAQRVDWENRLDWEAQHFLETPMLPLDRTEASCLKCHAGAGDVPAADALNEGRDLVRTYGCFGCHNIPGYESVRKVGPDLTTVSGKLTRDYMLKWLREPRAARAEARMPQFWFNSNNSGPEFEARNNTEIVAIADFLLSRSEARPLPVPARTNGDVARGQEIVETRGCLGCHAAGPIPEDPERTQHRRRFGYNLDGQGSKVSIEWLYNWVLDPHAVWPDTSMPSLRLTQAEAADVAAYLGSLTNPVFDALNVPEADQDALDVITREFLATGSTGIEAGRQLATMSTEDKLLYSGERLIARYGCFGCHTIEGFEDLQPIGTALGQAGSKLISQLDFGFMDIEHNRSAWYEQKLTDPRSFDLDRIRQPGELLRMPDFHFTEDQVDSIVLVLTGMVKDQVAPGMRNLLSAEVEAGRAMLARNNCRGCHVIEGAGGDIRSTIPDEGLWPPLLATQGAKTQPDWLHAFLVEPGEATLRPWLSARMPTFGFSQVEAGRVTAYFSAVDGVDYPFIDTSIATTNPLLATGRELFDEMRCALCHPTSDVLPPDREAADLAPNLNLAWERLRPEWVLDWILDPQALMPGTRMPEFFRNGQTDFPEYLDGNVAAQIQAIRDHIYLNLGDGERRTSATDD
jgi:cytochrome c2